KFKIAFFLTGRGALYNLLKSLNLKEGDEVLVQAFTCEAVILPIIALNLKPIYIDIESQSFSMNPIDLEKKITKRSKVLILQHTFGIKPAKRDTLLSFIKKHKLVLIEDIAHTIEISNIKYQKSKIANHFFLLSFGRSKSLSSVFGGAIVGNNKKVMEKLEKLALKQPSYSFIINCLLYKPIVMIIKSTYNILIGKLIHKIVSKTNLLIPEITPVEKKGIFNFIFDKAYPNALAILLLHQFKKNKKVQENRARICSFYLKEFSNCQFPISKQISNIKYRISNIPLIRFPVLVESREQIIKKLAKYNIFLGKWYEQVVAPKALDLKRVGYKQGSCPAAEKICQQIINLPTNVKIKEAEEIIKHLFIR
ncbi:MAG: DegT/DnrJ/EryC1/StrS family aminotransferase, partial [Microgenomates group bacterium]